MLKQVAKFYKIAGQIQGFDPTSITAFITTTSEISNGRGFLRDVTSIKLEIGPQKSYCAFELNFSNDTKFRFAFKDNNLLLQTGFQSGKSHLIDNTGAIGSLRALGALMYLKALNQLLENTNTEGMNFHETDRATDKSVFPDRFTRFRVLGSSQSAAEVLDPFNYSPEADYIREIEAKFRGSEWQRKVKFR